MKPNQPKSATSIEAHVFVRQEVGAIRKSPGYIIVSMFDSSNPSLTDSQRWSEQPVPDFVPFFRLGRYVFSPNSPDVSYGVIFVLELRFRSPSSVGPSITMNALSHLVPPLFFKKEILLRGSYHLPLKGDTQFMCLQLGVPSSV